MDVAVADFAFDETYYFVVLKGFVFNNGLLSFFYSLMLGNWFIVFGSQTRIL